LRRILAFSHQNEDFLYGILQGEMGAGSCKGNGGALELKDCIMMKSMKSENGKKKLGPEEERPSVGGFFQTCGKWTKILKKGEGEKSL
jgi:hypothetical protein